MVAGSKGVIDMARGRRDNLLRLYNQTQNDLDRALENIKLMTEIYGEIKPQHKEYLEMTSGWIFVTKELLETFRHRDM